MWASKPFLPLVIALPCWIVPNLLWCNVPWIFSPTFWLFLQSSFYFCLVTKQKGTVMISFPPRAPNGRFWDSHLCWFIFSCNAAENFPTLEENVNTQLWIHNIYWTVLNKIKKKNLTTELFAWELADKPARIITALLWSSFRWPQVSYAISSWGSFPPFIDREKGSSDRKIW